MTFAEARQRLVEAGYPIIEALDEVNHPSGHANGPHWHFVLGQREGDETTTDGPRFEPGTDEPDADGYRDTGTVVANSSSAPPQGQTSEFFALPDSWDQFAKGLEYGTGAVVEGIGDTLGIFSNPLSTTLGRAMGYENYTADLGDTLRDGLGLDRPPESDTGNRIAGDIVSGATGGLTFSGLAGAGGKATGTLVQQGLAKLAATPIRDAVAGGTSALAADAAEAAGAGPEGQTIAAIAGAGVGGLGIAPRGERALAPLTDRLMPKLAQERFNARQLANKHRALDKVLSGDVAKVLSGITEGGSRRLTKAQKADLLSRIGELEATYLPHADIKALALAPSAKRKLGQAMDRRHLLSESEIDALADGTPAGNAAAEGIRKAKRLRALVPQATSNANVKAFLAESLGGAVGSKLAGPLGGGVGARLGRKLSRTDTSAADKAAELAAQAPKFAQMPSEAFGAPDATAALRQLADETLDAKHIARQEGERLAAEGRKSAMLNARDDVRPGGGFRGYVYDKTGLLPSQQDAGALVALRDGKITPDQFQAFLDAPDKLMTGNAGNHLVDRLAEMAEAGRLQVDPKWTKPEGPTPVSPSLDAQGQPIRSVEAYRAGAARNIARDLPLLQELDAIQVERMAKYDSDPEFRKIAGTQADPYFPRIKALQDTLERNRSGSGEAK
jgi:hypothetical protein